MKGIKNYKRMENGLKKLQSEKKDKNTELRKMLSTAAISVALISWFTTANGLHAYVFKHIWQAYVMSAALQGALFSLSIRGVELFFDFAQKWKKISLVFVWMCLLFTSSIFSYVYISRDVYTDTLLREDAQRIFSTYCLEKNFELLDESDKLLNGIDDENGIQAKMDEYIKTLAVTKDGVSFSEVDLKNINDLETLIKTYVNKTSLGDSVYVDTEILTTYLKKVSNGKYLDHDVQILLSEAEGIVKKIDSRMQMIEKEIGLEENNRDGIIERLKTFRNTTNDAYRKLEEELRVVNENIVKLRGKLGKLNNEKENVSKVKTVINGIVGSKESTIYQEVVNIQTQMNAEKIDVNEVREISERIYNTLLESGEDPEEEKLAGYVEFKNNLKKYEAIISAQQAIEDEIKKLYNLSDKNEEFLATDELLEQQEKAVSNSNLNIDEIQKGINSNRLTMDETIWNNYWQMRLNSLRNNVQKLQSGGLKPEKINKMLEEIEVRERLYLSDLNDFERAINLLFGKEPKHPYKVLLRFSFFFSFGIDLFSVLMSCLLYIFKSKKVIVLEK